MAQRSLVRGSPRFLLQFLSVPVMDNTAMPGSNKSYRAYEFTPALPSKKMLWYRRHYLPNKNDWADPEASPLFWVGDWSQLPPALIIVGGLDVLRSEGEQFAEKLKVAGVKADLLIMKGVSFSLGKFKTCGLNVYTNRCPIHSSPRTQYCRLDVMPSQVFVRLLPWFFLLRFDRKVRNPALRLPELDKSLGCRYVLE